MVGTSLVACVPERPVRARGRTSAPLGDGGLDVAAVMLLVVVAANLLLENFVEPKVMGRTLDIHPLIVLVVTALGGLLGGLILAVPDTVIAATP
jgi:predicted PurR-regulated permease PerM